MDGFTQRDERDQKGQDAFREPFSDFDYASRANRQSSEVHVSADNGRINRLLSGNKYHDYQPFEEDFFESFSHFSGTEDSCPPLATYGPPAPLGFERRPPYTDRHSPAPSFVGRASEDITDFNSKWLANLPSDTPPIHRTQNVIVPSFEDSGMAQSSPQHVYTSAYERNRVPVWKESQYSGEYRRQELNDRVTQTDYVPVCRGSQDRGSQSSANSLSSGGATAGSHGHSREVMGRCEFCGYQALLSTVQEHWLGCLHRTAVRPASQGIWISR